MYLFSLLFTLYYINKDIIIIDYFKIFKFNLIKYAIMNRFIAQAVN